jgi:hypothetical protein
MPSWPHYHRCSVYHPPLPQPLHVNAQNQKVHFVLLISKHQLETYLYLIVSFHGMSKHDINAFPIPCLILYS